MTHELGYTRDDPAGAGSGNSRNDSGRKTISTANGPVTIDVPHNRNGTFEPKIVPKWARRLGQIDDLTTSSADLDEGSPGGAMSLAVWPTLGTLGGLVPSRHCDRSLRLQPPAPLPDAPDRQRTGECLAGESPRDARGHVEPGPASPPPPLLGTQQ
jgi:hypothetical protein